MRIEPGEPTRFLRLDEPDLWARLDEYRESIDIDCERDPKPGLPGFLLK